MSRPDGVSAHGHVGDGQDGTTGKGGGGDEVVDEVGTGIRREEKGRKLKKLFCASLASGFWRRGFMVIDRAVMRQFGLGPGIYNDGRCAHAHQHEAFEQEWKL